MMWRTKERLAGREESWILFVVEKYLKMEGGGTFGVQMQSF